MVVEKVVNTFLSFSYEIATKDSNSFVTFGRQTHDNCAATEGHTRLHGEHRDMEERARTQNSVVHKLFACKRNRMRSRSWPLFAERTRLLVLIFLSRVASNAFARRQRRVRSAKKATCGREFDSLLQAKGLCTTEF